MSRDGLVLDRYRLGRRLAAGSVGSVFAASDERSGNEVVVKIFSEEPAGRESWVLEMRLAMRLSHPHVTRCLDTGIDPSRSAPILVFERGLGGSLRRMQAEGARLSREDVARVGSDLAAGLAHAHAQGVLHRDVKPENVIALDAARKHWQLTDFGSGRFLERGTSTRSIAGSLEYMAPEVAIFDTDARSDLYSLGVLLLELHAGAPQTRSERFDFVAAHDGGVGLEGVIAALLHPLPGWRLPWASVLETLLHDPSVVLERRWIGACSTALRAGDRVWVGDGAGRAPRSLAVAGARCFVSIPGEPPLVASARRVLSVAGETPRIVFTSERELDFLVASTRFGRVLARDGGRLVAFGKNGEPMGEAEYPSGLALGAADCVWIDESTFVLAARGSEASWWGTLQGGLALVGRKSSAPHAAWTRFQEHVFEVGADDARVVLSRPGGDTSAVIEHARSRDTHLIPIDDHFGVSTVPAAAGEFAALEKRREVSAPTRPEERP